ncbi:MULTISPECIES: type II secretion system protein [Vibrio]|jgi:MSHA pilin protein MshA|uniref:MSHA pilin protein MshA n=1 Tax=Vibrio rotiferianus TaxID=190895 RepID=A0A2K7SUB5_9VIBR|nr:MULTISPECIES: type II secretion system protein [Vibrio]ASI95874.1 V10 pilin [Vibrio rotiferianus]MDK9776586.1 type II secretion system GspH family protein [Vibrio sp. D401a]MDK9806196.1 type II secretion system GspH family protein [Vibrio sp. D406a]NOH49822.1 type II secretion system protein [Vibrio rotiferianus]OHY92814.1 V10 pilin [Vibrio rotiferianus]
MKQTSKGFTLIELVVVIVILGILAVVAAPRFLNLQHDARVSSIQGMAASVHNAAELAFGKSAIEGQEKLPAYHVDGAGSVQFGYPIVENGGLEQFMTADMNYKNGDGEWVWDAFNTGKTPADPNYRVITQSKWVKAYDRDSIKASNCYVKYTTAMEEGDDYKVEVFTDGC